MARLRNNNFQSVQMPLAPTRAQLERVNDVLANFHGYSWGIDERGYHFFTPNGYLYVNPGDWIVVNPDRTLSVYDPDTYTALFQ